MKKNLTITFIIILIIGATLFKNNLQGEGGFVEFSLEGKNHHIDGVELKIRANPIFGEENQVRIIPREAETNFQYVIGFSPKKSKEHIKQIESRTKRLKKGETLDQNSSYYDFNFSWWIKTTTPENALKSRVSYGEAGENLELHNLLIDTEDWSLRCDEGYLEQGQCNVWIQVDEVDNEQVKGRFGGMFSASPPIWAFVKPQTDEHMRERKIAIENGTFNLPVKKFYKY